MAEFGAPTKYVAPVAVNPYTEILAPITAQGIDTAFPVTFDADKYDAEKLQIQSAGRALGFSIRVLETDYEEGSGRRKVKTTFIVRPARKAKGETAVEDAPETDAE